MSPSGSGDTAGVKVRRTVAGPLVVAVALGCWLGTEAARSRLPQAGVFVSTLRVPLQDTPLLAAYGRSLYALVLPEEGGRTPIPVMRVTRDGKVVRRKLRGLPSFLSDVSAGPAGFYAGTYVIKRFRAVPDELIGISLTTLGIAASAYFRARVSPLVAGGRLWASIDDGHVVRLDPRTLRLEASSRQIAFSLSLGTPPYLSTPALGFGSLWVLVGRSGYLDLLRLNPVWAGWLLRRDVRDPDRMDPDP